MTEDLTNMDDFECATKGFYYGDVNSTVMKVLLDIPFIKDCIKSWEKDPPVKTGGVYWSSNPQLEKKGWRPAKCYHAPMQLLLHFIRYLLDNGLLCPRFRHFSLRTVSLMYSSNVGVAKHTEDPEIAPAGFAVINLKHFFKKPARTTKRARQEQCESYYYLHFCNLEGEEVFHLDVHEHMIYSLERHVLKNYQHGSTTTGTPGMTGKVFLRLSFERDCERKEVLQDDDEFTFSESVSPALNDLQAESLLLFSHETIRRETEMKTAIAAQAKEQQLSECIGMTESHKKTVAKLVLEAKYHLQKLSVLKTDGTYRKLFSADIADMRVLRLNLKEHGPSLLHAQSDDIGGTAYGGGIFTSQKDCKDLAMACWTLAKQWPTACGSFWDTDEANDYMSKMVVHLEGPGLTTLSLPRLTGSLEEDRVSLEQKRRKNTLVIDKKGVHLHGMKSTFKADHDNLDFAKWKSIVEMVRDKLPRKLRQYTNVVYDLTILFSGTVTPDHVDDPTGDGPGHLIVNLCLNGDGLLIFSSEADANADFVGCYMMANAWIAFTDELRYAATHQVLRLEQTPSKVDFNLKRPRVHDRIVLTVRFGKPTKANQQRYDDVVGNRIKQEQKTLRNQREVMDLTTEVSGLKSKLSAVLKCKGNRPSMHVVNTVTHL
jgi:hypothetical protein